MKTTTLLAGTGIVALSALSFLPSLQAYAPHAVAASGILALWLVLRAVAAPAEAEQSDEHPEVPATPPRPATPVVRNLSEAEAIGLLGVFQSKGRLVDFLMDDIAAYSDAQVGAAARVVQQGCKTALLECFSIVPVSNEREGTQIAVPAGAPAGDYEFVGKVAGEPPFSGVLVHKGWKATSVKLPRSLLTTADRLPPIAPAQVELR